MITPQYAHTTLTQWHPRLHTINTSAARVRQHRRPRRESHDAHVLQASLPSRDLHVCVAGRPGPRTSGVHVGARSAQRKYSRE